MQLQAILAALLAMAPAAVYGAADVRGSADHALFPNRMPGHSIGTYETKEFAAFQFPSEPAVTVEGKYTKISYYRDTGQHPGGLAIRRNYENAIKSAGGEVVLSRGNYSVLRGLWQGSEVWAHIQAADTGSYYFLTVVEKAPMVQVITAAQMGTALDGVGFIALDVNFDTGKADIRPESQPIIAEIVGLMKARPELRVGVEGHTDNVGNPASNKALSLARANAVVAAMVAAGVDRSRLVPAGFGQEQPIADNRLEEGRAKNRRVELVKK
jgi:outer membrane protein OmpA-like peptidoglycan-associated protein